ncbi:NUDIX hydrolase [Marinicrinis lubricantis]|uniref:NUDIX hydrolase n=1 Tax=Marinicrinis lubricantis TaxID=2086470 RepID=A0ABW1ITH8_9BACL
MQLKWLEWAKQIQAISQNGLAYSKDPYDIERFHQLRSLSLEIMNEYTGVETERIEGWFANEIGYATPKVDVRAVVFQEDRILLVKETIDGLWALPGGWADIGLTPSQIAVKEVREESGYEVEPIRLLAVLDKMCHPHPPSPFHVYKIFILCKLVGGEAKQSIETSETGFFPLDALPPLSTERNTESQIQAMYKAAADPLSPVIYD